jgi:hypothetical protein
LDEKFLRCELSLDDVSDTLLSQHGVARQAKVPSFKPRLRVEVGNERGTYAMFSPGLVDVDE